MDCFEDMFDDGFVTCKCYWLKTSSTKEDIYGKPAQQEKLQIYSGKISRDLRLLAWQLCELKWVSVQLEKNNKALFLEQFSNITDPNLIENKVQLKGSSKLIFTAPKIVYTNLSENCMQISTKYITCLAVTLLQIQALPMRQTYRKRKSKLSMHQLPKPTPSSEINQHLSQVKKFTITKLFDWLH